MTYNEMVSYLAGRGTVITTPAEEGLRKYGRMLLAANRRVNLTAAMAEEELVRKHILDTLLALPYVPPDCRVIDVGSGGGLPGLPWAIVRQDLRVTLLESIGKKSAALSEMIALLGLTERVDVLTGRAEVIGQRAEYREQYDCAASRAVARLNVLAEYCLPFVRVSGVFLALKGPAVAEELREADRSISQLGGRVLETAQWQLPGGEERRSLVLTVKERATPGAYPRREGVPSKRPL